MNCYRGKTEFCISGPWKSGVWISVSSMWCLNTVPNRWQHWILSTIFSMFVLYFCGCACFVLCSRCLNVFVCFNERMILERKEEIMSLFVIFSFWQKAIGSAKQCVMSEQAMKRTKNIMQLSLLITKNKGDNPNCRNHRSKHVTTRQGTEQTEGLIHRLVNQQN